MAQSPPNGPAPYILRKSRKKVKVQPRTDNGWKKQNKNQWAWVTDKADKKYAEQKKQQEWRDQLVSYLL